MILNLLMVNPFFKNTGPYEINELLQLIGLVNQNFPQEKIDDIKYLKDYSSIVKFLKEFVQKSKYKSIERLTFECANILEKKYKLKNLLNK